MSNPSCKTCKFWRGGRQVLNCVTNEPFTQLGYCRYGPPAQSHPQWPETFRDDWCGSHSPLVPPKPSISTFGEAAPEAIIPVAERKAVVKVADLEAIQRKLDTGWPGTASQLLADLIAKARADAEKGSAG